MFTYFGRSQVTHVQPGSACVVSSDVATCARTKTGQLYVIESDPSLLLQEEAERLLRGASWNVDRAFDAFYTGRLCTVSWHLLALRVL